MNVIEIVGINSVKFGRCAATGENAALAVRGKHDDGYAGMRSGQVGNIAAIDTFFVKRGNNSSAGGIVSNAAHKDGFMTIASKSGGGISGAAACAKFDLVDIDFGAKLDLIEETTLVGAEVVMVN